MKLTQSIILALFSLITFQSLAVEVHLWKGEPIKLTFEVGKQRIIKLPDHAEMAVSKSISDKVKIDPANGSIYFTATDSFDEHIAVIKLIGSQQQIRLFISAVEPSEGPVEDVKIEVFSNKSASPSVGSVTPSDIPAFMQKKTASLLEVLRYTFKIYWVQPRLRPKQLPVGMTPVKVNKNLDLSTFFQSCSLGVFSAEVIEGWRLNNGTYVTTVLVSNQTEQQRYFNLTHVNVQSLHISPYKLYVTPKGQVGDKTTMTIISDIPFSTAIRGLPFQINRHGQGEGCVNG